MFSFVFKHCLLPAGLSCLAMPFASAQMPTLRVDPAGGAATFPTLQAAVDHAPSTGAIIRLAPGVYKEKVSITTPRIVLVGTGASPQDTVITWGDSAKNTGSTFKSGTITVGADGFEAENLSVVNTWWDDHPAKEDRSQAVALQLEGDQAVLDRVRLVSAQDTLFANSHACRGTLTSTCRADRQFFNDCYVEGNVDYIFGDAKAVFANCELHSRPGSGVMITAQSRASLLADSSYTFLHCRITGPDEGNRIFLGRPWREFATVTFYDTDIEQKLDPAGWQEWGGRLQTAVYREYKSHGPAADTHARVVTSPPLSPAEEARMTPDTLLDAGTNWSPTKEVTHLRALAAPAKPGR